MRALLLCSLALVAPGLLAQTPTAPSTSSPLADPSGPPVEVRYERRTVIEISEAAIEGVVVGPSTTAVRGGRRPAFKHLIRLRPDFRKELSATPDTISAGR